MIKPICAESAVKHQANKQTNSVLMYSGSVGILIFSVILLSPLSYDSVDMLNLTVNVTC